MIQQDYEKNKEILMRFINARDEVEVEKILGEPFFNNVKWRPLGGKESNYAIVAAQQSDPIDALCEKPVNSIDHLLLKECKKAGIDAEGPHAPKSMQEAVEKFFKIRGGDLTQLSDKENLELAKNIMIIADGDKRNPNIIVVDRGEGQKPDDFKDTLLSLERSNKNKIKFVQGKYNMGGTGVLPFCGKRGYQLILSRKSIELTDQNSEWGFTLIRERPNVEEGYKTTWYEYFTDFDDNIFKVNGIPLKILPDGEELIDGCFIKLYSYDLPHPSLITINLWQELNSRLFAPAFPILVVENRKDEFDMSRKRGHSFMIGNKFRAMKNKNVYKTISIKSSLQGFGNNTIEVTIFKHSSKTNDVNVTDTYTQKKECVFLTQNGQRHFAIGRSTFNAKTNLAYLADYVMVHVDLTHIDRTKSKIFMASRDRARDSEDYRELQKKIFEDIKEDLQIIAINKEYQQLEMQSIARDSKIEDDIANIMNKNPSLWDLFNPESSSLELDNIGKNKKPPFTGQYIPTFLRVKGYFGPGDRTKAIPCNGEPAYEYLLTDAQNNYLTREVDGGTLEVSYPKELLVTYHEPFNGKIVLKMTAPNNAIVGDIVGMLTVKLTRPNDSPLVCNINLEYYLPKKTNQPKAPRKPRTSGSNIPTLDRVTSVGWGKFSWDETYIAKVEPDVIHVNMECKHLTDYLKTRPTAHKEKICNTFAMAMYFHSLALHSELKDNPNYEEIFKKCMSSCARASLPVLYDAIANSFTELLKATTQQAFATKLEV